MIRSASVLSGTRWAASTRRSCRDPHQRDLRRRGRRRRHDGSGQLLRRPSLEFAALRRPITSKRARSAWSCLFTKICRPIFDNSAYFNAYNMTVPLLLEVGDSDGTVAWHQGIELYNVARRAKRTLSCWPIWARIMACARKRPERLPAPHPRLVRPLSERRSCRKLDHQRAELPGSRCGDQAARNQEIVPFKGISQRSTQRPSRQNSENSQYLRDLCVSVFCARHSSPHAAGSAACRILRNSVETN